MFVNTRYDSKYKLTLFICLFIFGKSNKSQFQKVNYRMPKFIRTHLKKRENVIPVSFSKFGCCRFFNHFLKSSLFHVGHNFSYSTKLFLKRLQTIREDIPSEKHPVMVFLDESVLPVLIIL